MIHISSNFTKMFRSDFVRNVGVLAGGTAFAQAITVLILPILTRIYSPSDFAVLAVFTSFITTVLSFSTLRLNVAIPIPESQRQAAILLVCSVTASTGVSLIIAAFVFGAPAFSQAIIGSPGIVPYLWLLPVGVWFSSLYNSLQFWSSRQKLFRTVAQTRVTQSVGAGATQIGMGMYGFAPYGLLLGSVFAQSLGVLRLLVPLLKKDRQNFRYLKSEEIKETLVTFKKFPIYSLPEAVLNTGIVHIPILIIAASQDQLLEAGYLFLALRMFSLPMRLIGRSVAQVFLVEAADRHRAGTLRRFTLATMLGLAKIGGVPFLVIGALAPFIFPVVFGQDWAPAGNIVSWLTPWFIFQFVSSPVSTVLHVTNKFKTALALQAFGFVTVTGSVIAAVQFAPSILIQTYAAAGAGFYLVYCFVVLKLDYSG